MVFSIASILYHKYQVLPHDTFSKCCHSWWNAANISNPNSLLTDVSSRSLNHYRQICVLRWYCNSCWLKPTQLSLSSTTNIKEQSTEILWQRPALNNSHYLTDTFRSWHLSNQKKKSTTAHFDTKQSKHKTDSLCLHNYTSFVKESNWCHKQLSFVIFTVVHNLCIWWWGNCWLSWRLIHISVCHLIGS